MIKFTKAVGLWGWRVVSFPFRARAVRGRLGRAIGRGVGLLDEGSEVVVSLTSYPRRFGQIWPAIFSILDQRVKPGRVVLWLSREECPNELGDVPQSVTRLMKLGLEIRFVENNIRSYKKLLPALCEFPDSIIVTADDDAYYSRDWLGKLIEGHVRWPGAIINNPHAGARRVRVVEGEAKRVYARVAREPLFDNVVLGVGGTLYPPKCLHLDVTNVELIKRLQPKMNNDDIWFWIMAVRNGTKVKYIKGTRTNDRLPFYLTKSRQEGGLFDENRVQNDIDIRNALAAYPDAAARLG